MYYIFYSTNNVFIGEEILKKNKIQYTIVPTPVKDSIYCGVCLLSDEKKDKVMNLFSELKFITYEK
jgi:hypothetical protein